MPKPFYHLKKENDYDYVCCGRKINRKTMKCVGSIMMKLIIKKNDMLNWKICKNCQRSKQYKVILLQLKEENESRFKHHRKRQR